MELADIKIGQLVEFRHPKRLDGIRELGLVVERPKGMWVWIKWLDGDLSEASRNAIILVSDVKQGVECGKTRK